MQLGVRTSKNTFEIALVQNNEKPNTFIASKTNFAIAEMANEDLQL
jgi:hypothetical protein